MTMSPDKKRSVLISGTIGLALGFFMFIALWVMTHNWVTVFIIPIAALMGAAQAYMSPGDDD